MDRDAAETPGVVVCTLVLTISSRASRWAPRRPRLLDAMERERRRRRLLATASFLDKRIPPLWESRPQEFHLDGSARLARADRHCQHVEDRARVAGFEGPIGVAPIAWPVTELRRAPRWAPTRRLVRKITRQADPSLWTRLRAATRSPGGATPRRRVAPGSIRPENPALVLSNDGSPRGYVTRPALVVMPPATSASTCAAHDGESGSVIRKRSLGSRSASATWAVLGADGRARLRCPWGARADRARALGCSPATTRRAPLCRERARAARRSTIRAHRGSSTPPPSSRRQVEAVRRGAPRVAGGRSEVGIEPAARGNEWRTLPRASLVDSWAASQRGRARAHSAGSIVLRSSRRSRMPARPSHRRAPVQRERAAGGRRGDRVRARPYGCQRALSLVLEPAYVLLLAPDGMPRACDQRCRESLAAIRLSCSRGECFQRLSRLARWSRWALPSLPTRKLCRETRHRRLLAAGALVRALSCERRAAGRPARSVRCGLLVACRRLRSLAP